MLGPSENLCIHRAVEGAGGSEAFHFKSPSLFPITMSVQCASVSSQCSLYTGFVIREFSQVNSGGLSLVTADFCLMLG